MGRNSRSSRGDLGLGLLLIILGAVLLADRVDYLEFSIGGLWPWFVIGWGIVRMLSWESPRRVGGGVTGVLFGIWFLIAVNEWNGIGWSESWPLALVAVGGGILTRVALQRAWPAGSGSDDSREAGGRGGDASGGSGGVQ